MTGSDQTGVFSSLAARSGDSNAPLGIADVCSRLTAALAEFETLQSQLDGDHLPDTPDAEIATALAAVRAARGRCKRLADVVLQARPRTAAEAALRQGTLSTYLTRIDVDQLTRRSVFEPEINCDVVAGLGATSTASPPFRSMPWKTWLGLGSARRPA